jgi:aminoglycoside phosphotransferase
MADSPAVRSRRYRLHKAGDHSLCRHKLAVCDAESPAVAVEIALDPAAELERLAARLTRAHERDPGNAPLARELRLTLAQLAAAEPGDADDDDPLSELRALAESVP